MITNGVVIPWNTWYYRLWHTWIILASPMKDDVMNLSESSSILWRNWLWLSWRHYTMTCRRRTTSTNEAKETKDQIFCNFLSLLVCPFSHSGRWSPEIPDIGWLLRFIRISRDNAITVGHSTHTGSIQINKRISRGLCVQQKKGIPFLRFPGVLMWGI